MADGTTDPVPVTPDPEAQQELELAEYEGFLSYVKRPNKSGWSLYGFRVFSVVMILVMAFAIGCAGVIVYSHDIDFKKSAFGALQLLTTTAVGMLLVLKAKTGGM